MALPGIDPVELAAGSDDGVVRLLSVGAIVPRKGYDVLVAALAKLSDLPWRLTIVGDRTRSPETAALLDIAIARAQLGDRIELTGAVPDAHLAACYRAADIFVLASYFEGYGMAAAEAIAYGLPVIATTAGALPQTLTADAAILVPPGDVAALGAALYELLSDPDARRARSEAARAAARALPTWRATAQQIAQAIEAS